MTDKYWIIFAYCILLTHLEINIIMIQQVKQTATLPVDEMKILGQWNWSNSVPSSESHSPFEKENEHEKSF